MESFEVQSSLPPAAVVRALTAYAAEWRESRLPAALRTSHATGVGFEATGTRFRLWAQYARPDPFTPVCEGTVARAPGGGSVIRARAGVPGRQQALFPMVGTIPGLLAFATSGGRDAGALAFAAMGGALGAAFLLVARALLARRIARETGALGDAVRAAIEAAAAPAA